MTEISQNLLGSPRYGNWIRLRTLVLLRWWAIIGQISALVIARRMYDLNPDMSLCYLVIGISVVTNLIANSIYPESKRLTESETLLIVFYDLLHLGLMLYLTGGLNNPFSILIVGPVIVSASAVSPRSTLYLGFATIVIVSILTKFYLPLRTADGTILGVPDLFLFGNWAAIVISVLFLGVYARWIVAEMRSMSKGLQATQMALAREQKLTDLGGVVAAAAHELGTPLATIKLASSELADDLKGQEELREDAILIGEQADRCRDILHSMGRAGKDDMLLREAPLTALIEVAAKPHVERGKLILFDHGIESGPLTLQPNVLRRPEVIHGLRNLIQNAVDFADRNVWVESSWTDERISVRIMDDGPGYPANVLGRIGEPFMRRRNQGNDPRRPEYHGMGLGLFIAITLLERSGGELTFANGSDSFQNHASHAERNGAVVEVVWPRHRLEGTPHDARPALGENVPLEI